MKYVHICLYELKEVFNDIMEELIKKFEEYSPEEQQRLNEKYKDSLYQYFYGDAQGLKLTLYCLEYLVKHINENYKDEPKESVTIKAWCAVILMRRIKNNSINTEEDIIEIITKTFEHFKKEEYSIYLSDIAMFNNEYIRDIEYLNKLTI